MADGYNDARAGRVAAILQDFRNLQHYIAAVSINPPNSDEYYTEGYAALRQCALDGQHILNAAADTSVPRAHGALEQQKAELQQITLDSYARRHEAQKIYLRQEAVQHWIGWRQTVLQGQRPHSGHSSQLRACDHALRAELTAITDESVYADLRASDEQVGYWTYEDPSLRNVQRWLRARR